MVLQDALAIGARPQGHGASVSNTEHWGLNYAARERKSLIDSLTLTRLRLFASGVIRTLLSFSLLSLAATVEEKCQVNGSKGVKLRAGEGTAARPGGS